MGDETFGYMHKWMLDSGIDSRRQKLMKESGRPANMAAAVEQANMDAVVDGYLADRAGMPVRDIETYIPDMVSQWKEDFSASLKTGGLSEEVLDEFMGVLESDSSSDYGRQEKKFSDMLQTAWDEYAMEYMGV